MTTEELKVILDKHEKWLRGEDGGECADLYGASLCGADLNGANLCKADLHDANLYGADMRGAKLLGANLRSADLHNANLQGADLRAANLYGADMRGAYLYGADLYGADLHYANLRSADLRDANLYCTNLRSVIMCDADLCCADISDADLRKAVLRDAKNVPFIPIVCPDSGSFVGWKKAGGLLVKLLIPEDARRSSAVGRKCRCDKAQVIAIETLDGKPAETNVVNSNYDKSFVYEIGKTVEEPNFHEDRFQECAPGIHFFINRQEAVYY